MKAAKLVAPILSMALLAPSAINVFAEKPAAVEKVEFIGMDAPKTPEEKAAMYSSASAVITYDNGAKKPVSLEYKTLFKPGDVINGKAAGATYDANGNVINDPQTGNPYISTAPDSNTLLSVNGKSGKLFLLNHYESIPSSLGNLPKAMVLNTVEQDKKTGELKVTDMQPVDFSGDGGIWTPCAGSLSPWNTHLGSEEYEPDAKSHELNPENSPVTQFARNFYKNNEMIGNPYLYGHLPEVKVHPNGTATAVKHYSMGRLSYERVVAMPDDKTVYYGDDGSYTMLFMYIADKAQDLSAGTLYAGKWNQTGDQNGGSANLEWIKLGHATDSEIKEMAQTLKFSDIFETTTDDAFAAANGFKKIKTNSSGAKNEWLKIKPGMEKAAAFLESRRYGALVGATSEFNKMEAVEVNKQDNKVYVAMSNIKSGMEANSNDPVDDIHVSKINAGGIYELRLAEGQTAHGGETINSKYVAATMTGILMGEDLQATDAAGNKAHVDKLANPDNVVYSEEMRTLFISEDSSMHSNNFTWAFNIDTKQLSRIASVPTGGEATGLQMVNDLNGFSYLMLSSQNPGNVGYLAGIPVLNDRSK